MGAIASQITSLTIVFLNCLFKHRSKKTSKLRVTGLCGQMASNAENVSIWWRHHEMITVIQFNIAIGFNINGHDILSEYSEINNIWYLSFILLSLHSFKCASWPKHIHKLYILRNVNLNTKWLIQTPASFLKETYFYNAFTDLHAKRSRLLNTKVLFYGNINQCVYYIHYKACCNSIPVMHVDKSHFPR